MKIKSCGIIPILKQNDKIKFLLIQHQTGHWSFPKGRQEKTETQPETAQRELIEETGIKDFKILNDIYFTEKYDFEENGEKYDKEVKYFVALVKNPKVKLLKSELKNYRWVEFDKAMELITYASTKDIFKIAQKYINKKAEVKI